MLKVLERITEGKGKIEDMAMLKRIAFSMQKASLCGLGQTAPNPVLSTVRYFEAEYKEHILNKKCPSKKCSQLASYMIIQDKCKKCGVCQKHCPTAAIPGSREEGYIIKQDKCVKCGQCFEACKFKAIARE